LQARAQAVQLRLIHQPEANIFEKREVGWPEIKCQNVFAGERITFIVYQSG
jgi:hypothetical protein